MTQKRLKGVRFGGRTGGTCTKGSSGPAALRLLAPSSWWVLALLALGGCGEDPVEPPDPSSFGGTQPVIAGGSFDPSQTRCGYDSATAPARLCEGRMQGTFAQTDVQLIGTEGEFPDARPDGSGGINSTGGSGSTSLGGTPNQPIVDDRVAVLAFEHGTGDRTCAVNGIYLKPGNGTLWVQFLNPGDAVSCTGAVVYEQQVATTSVLPFPVPAPGQTRWLVRIEGQTASLVALAELVAAP